MVMIIICVDACNSSNECQINSHFYLFVSYVHLLLLCFNYFSGSYFLFLGFLGGHCYLSYGSFLRLLSYLIFTQERKEML